MGFGWLIPDSDQLIHLKLMMKHYIKSITQIIFLVPILVHNTQQKIVRIIIPKPLGHKQIIQHLLSPMTLVFSPSFYLKCIQSLFTIPIFTKKVASIIPLTPQVLVLNSCSAPTNFLKRIPWLFFLASKPYQSML